MKTTLPQNNLQGKTCLITGATSGIGKVTALELARMGAQIVIAARNQKKAETTASWIKAETGNPQVEYLLADFEDLDQVRGLAKQFQSRFDRLDVLLNNAGAVYLHREISRYGVEKTLLVNHLAPFLLTGLLLEQLKHAAESRIINVSSSSHRSGRLDLTDMEFAHGYSVIKAYERSKLANVLFTYQLARRLDGSRVTTTAVHPGRVGTEIWHVKMRLVGWLLYYLMKATSLSPEQGADSLIYLAASPEARQLTGAYIINRKAVPSSPLSYDRRLGDQLWEASERLTGLSY